MADERKAADADPAPAPALDLPALGPRLAAALEEDLGAGDVTSLALIPEDAVAEAVLVAREAGVICGLPLIEPLLRLAAERDPVQRVSGTLTSGFLTRSPMFVSCVTEGTRVESGDVLGRVSGPLRTILAAERTMLNYLQRLSGIATLTAEYAAACVGTDAVIVDTRKTTPGLRDLEKYAVRVGGGQNHRMGLYDAVLIKDNHLDGGRLSPADAVRRAREAAPEAAFVEIEVRSLDDLKACLPTEPDIIMPDNFTVEALREAVAAVKAYRQEWDGTHPQTSLGVAPERPLVEASGGISLENVRDVARTGVDRIAVGALTHSAPALDIALDVVGEGSGFGVQGSEEE